MKPIIVALALFLLAFISVRQLDPKGILFYQGIMIGLVIAIGLGAFLIMSERTGFIPAFKDSLLAFCLMYMFAFTIPTTVDRSYSVEMLNRLAASENGLNKNEINSAYTNYFIEGGGVEKRLQEQVETGTIRQEDGKFSLTPMGRLLTRAFHVTAVLFKCGSQSGD